MLNSKDQMQNALDDCLRIVAFEPSHAEAFRDLNLDWIEEYFVVEDLDRTHLDFPQESFVDTGGAILMAELGGRVVGCCALLKHGDSVYEVSKMAVMRECQGVGIGKRLLHAVIEHARSLGARRLDIISSTRLPPAIELYKKAGFVVVPLESDAYARGNIALELRLPDAE
ncbi:MAG: GNAT family N-acetyltransferase [Betaproteobacteria bacterium]|nr:MAG: GNAT family N-acetyltransferase [Betaproteobacteria bacterium]